MNNRDGLLLGVLMGAILMYFLDPDRGRRRRALVRDQVLHGAHELEDLGGDVASKARHFRNVARGAIIESRTRLQMEEVDDAVLEARVRSQLGRQMPNLGEIMVSAEHGRVTLRGTAGQAEAASLVDAVQNIRGVHDVINRLESPETAG